MRSSNGALPVGVFQTSMLGGDVGGSMGAQQTYEWAVRYPDMVKRAAPFAGTAKTTPHNYLFVRAHENALKSDPAWNARSSSLFARPFARKWVEPDCKCKASTVRVLPSIPALPLPVRGKPRSSPCRRSISKSAVSLSVTHLP